MKKRLDWKNNLDILQKKTIKVQVFLTPRVQFMLGLGSLSRKIPFDINTAN